MKKMIWKSVAIMAIGLFTFAACDTPEQSEFTVESITTKATIKGQAYYQTGMVEGVSKEKIEYPVGKKVFVDVPLIVYGGPSGFKTFETTMNANGEFSINIPCPKNGILTSQITIRFETFEGQQTSASDEVEKGVFQVLSSQLSIFTINTRIYPTDIIDIRNTDAGDLVAYEFVTNNSLEEYKESITIIGFLTKEVVKVNYVTGLPGGTPAQISSIGTKQDSVAGDVTVEVVYPNGDKRYYKATAAAITGEFKAVIPIQPSTTDVSVRIWGTEHRATLTSYHKKEINQSSGAEYTTAKTFEGYYVGNAFVSPQYFTLSPIQKVVQYSGTVSMTFSADPVSENFKPSGSTVHTIDNIFEYYGFDEQDGRYLLSNW